VKKFVKNSMTSLFINEFLLKCINFYQLYISPHKGCQCAYAIYYKDESCSSWACTTIKKNGWLTFFLSLKNRAYMCNEAKNKIHKKNTDNGMNSENERRSQCEETASCCIWLIPW
jgi:putative component of membrane protein insertase Oxa1/YidC/SpoIIIJ protein YidD